MARSFFEPSLNPKFITNLHHHALYLQQMEDRRDIPDPGRNPYMTEELWSIIRHVKDEGLLNMSRMITGEYYRALLENNITMPFDDNGRSSLKPCKAELVNPGVDWQRTWHLASHSRLSSEDQTFLWRMLHNILPTQARLHRMGMRNSPTPNCLHCDSSEPESLQHVLVSCPGLEPQQIVLLDLGNLEESTKFTIVWFIYNVLTQVWQARKDKKSPNLFSIRSTL